ncbi:hypothetical protein OSTOST_17691 [Ostertagia ostertagi]
MHWISKRFSPRGSFTVASRVVRERGVAWAGLDSVCCVMPQRLERTARALCLTLNTVFFLLSICLIAFVCLAAINAPKPDISPQPLNSYPQHQP